MRKIRFLFCIILLMFMTACGSNKDQRSNALLHDDITEESKSYIVVGFSQIGSESDWRAANTESFQETFTEENGYYFLYDDAQQKQENQVKALRNFILQEVDYIILDPIVETGWDAVLQEAKDAGIPVILADRSVDVADDDLYTCWVGSDFKGEGRKAGEWLERYLSVHNRSDEEINIVTLLGTLNSSAQIGRTKGFDQVLKLNDNWHMLEQQSGDFTQAKGHEVMKYFLDTYDDIDVVVSENDNMAFGAISAIKEAGLTTGVDGDIIMLSFDAVNAAFDAMQAGEINADFECNPLIGPMVSDIIHELERGEEVEKIKYVDEKYFDTSMDLANLRKERTY